MKNLIILLCLVLPASVVAQNKFLIKGTVSSNILEKKAFLNYQAAGTEKYHSDSAEIKNGSFSFTGSLDKERLSRVVLSVGNSGSQKKRNDQLILFVKDNDEVFLTLEKDVKSAKIKGSVISSNYQKLTLSTASAANDTERNVLYENYIRQNPGLSISLDLIRTRFATSESLQGTDYDKANELFNILSDELKNSSAGERMKKQFDTYKSLTLGATLPGFSATTAEGKTINLSDYRGKYVLVDFWASWCIPCRKEFPYLKEAYSKFKDKNFEILGYSIDEKKSLWLSAVENDGVEWPQVCTLQGLSDPTAVKFLISAIPRNYLLDPQGKIIGYNLRGEDVIVKLNELIK